jgi:hypothetical protein
MITVSFTLATLLEWMFFLCFLLLPDSARLWLLDAQGNSAFEMNAIVMLFFLILIVFYQYRFVWQWFIPDKLTHITLAVANALPILVITGHLVIPHLEGTTAEEILTQDFFFQLLIQD